jgi:hypothetical protein
MSAIEGTQRFAQATSWQQGISPELEIPIDENNVKVSPQAAMLEAIVQQPMGRPMARFVEKTLGGLVPPGPDNNWDSA